MSFSGTWKNYYTNQPIHLGSCGCGIPSDIPTPIDNTLIFQVTGNYYNHISWYNSNREYIIPVQASVQADRLSYDFTFYKPVSEELCGSKILFYFKTFEDVMPRVYEIISQQEMNVDRVYRHNGQTIWSLRC